MHPLLKKKNHTLTQEITNFNGGSFQKTSEQHKATDKPCTSLQNSTCLEFLGSVFQIQAGYEPAVRRFLSCPKQAIKAFVFKSQVEVQSTGI